MCRRCYGMGDATNEDSSLTVQKAGFAGRGAACLGAALLPWQLFAVADGLQPQDPFRLTHGLCSRLGV